MAALGWIAFIVALLASVMLHEAGHLIPAKRFGMKATQYFVGFGPTLWSRRRGETEYGIKLILLGGFVKIVGYTPLEEIPKQDRARAFYRQPARRRAVVIAGGVVMNFIFAFVLLMVLAMAIGEYHAGTATTTVDQVSTCVPADRQEDSSCEGRPESPARVAGARPGDTVVSFNGRPVGTWDELSRAIKDSRAGVPVPVVVRRGGRDVTLRMTPAERRGSPFLGVTSRVVGERYERQGPIGAATFAARGIGETVEGIGRVFADLPSAIPKLFGEERAETPGGQVGSVVGATEVSGQIFTSDEPWRGKIAIFLSLVISVNIFLGALNVLPLLPLDGGHLAVLAYERTRAWLARRRGRPDPGTVDMTKLLPVTYLAVLLLVGLGVLLILADLINPLRLPR